ncbi:hypothetical protein Val02_64860 [Virgisporangium aliadipatigenens]|uniref:DUF7668 domain-containing protein n=1 Tax=Virgisporangium aliadipatigenens TaxID=741659 RepID=A0A8J4DSU3_9ACTN|nr:hypothetical protein [Virgisporangium aliadipatigenens]GIJ49600.1 hypothetical protein Val02_64860 [Virgisporangium aliadipatigenens]
MREAMLTAVQTLVGLIVRGEYDTAAAVTRGRRLTAEEIRQAVTEHPGTLVNPPEHVFDEIEFDTVTGSEPLTYFAVCPLWDADGEESDLSLEVELEEIGPGLYVPIIANLHVM